jgi:hypothetical protein
MFININTKYLWAYFIAHKGKKKLMVNISLYSLDNINIGKFT